jgi:hypothetical protein
VATRGQAAERVNLGFGIHLGVYVTVVAGLAVLNLTRRPDKLWVLWVAGGWGLGVLLHAVLAFTPVFRERAINKAMARMNSRGGRKPRRGRRAKG